MPAREDREPRLIKLHIPDFVSFILNRLKYAGHQAYIVGGAVRDACLHRPIIDWDVATPAQPEEIKTVFCDVRSFALKHGTVTLVDSGRRFEVTHFRGRRNSLRGDLAHRDFTINAMAYDPEKAELLDPFGGRVDIRRRIIRTVGNPQTRFQEDPLRLLRAVRIVAELRFRIEQETLTTLVKMAPRIKDVASERIREELMKILMSPKPSQGFNLMVRTQLLKYLLPELLEGYRMRQNAYHRYTIFKHIMEAIDIVDPVPVLRLTALLHDIAKPRVRKKEGGQWRFHGHEAASATLAEEIMDRLRFSKDMTGKVANLIRHHFIHYDSGWSDGAVRRLIRRVGLEQITDLLIFRRADILAHGLVDRKSDLLAELDKRVEGLIKSPIATRTQDLALNGTRVMEILGISPGPKVGEALNFLMEKITDHPELNTKRRLEAILEQMKASSLT
jgi:tRNA nucleotidyltransferase (CCA-adding enzyme)